MAASAPTVSSLGSPSRPILVVEDEPGDVLLLRRALERVGVAHPLAVVGDGEAALRYLVEQAAHPDQAALPALVLLDLKLPGQSGVQVLRQVKQTPLLRRLPVVVVTTTADPASIEAAYEAGASGCVTKPLGFIELCDLAAALRDYWLVWNVAPLARR